MAMPGLRQVAMRAGVSLASASYALRGDPRIAPATAERVRAAAAALGWRASPELARRASSRFLGPAAAIPIAHITWLKAPGPTTGSVVRRARDLGWEVHTHLLAPDDEPARLRDRLLQAGMRGAILDPGPSRPDLAGFDWSPLPVVMGWHDGPPGPHPAVREIDPFAAVAACTRRLAAAGHRRIGYAVAAHAPRLDSDDRRLAGWLSARGAVRIPPLRCSMGWTEERSTQALLAWVRRHRVEAVVGFSVWSWYVLRRHAPGVACAAQLIDPDDPWGVPVAGCVIDPPVIASTLCAILEQRMRGWRAPACELVLPPRWKDGASLLPRTRQPTAEGLAE